MSRLFFRSPAVRWQQALPIGNGKTAVMVYGGRKKERLCFNDAEFWSGAPSVHDRAEVCDALPRARALVAARKYGAAHDFVRDNMYGDYSEAYMPLAELTIALRTCGGKKSYTRALSMDEAVIAVSDGSTVREAFVSHPDDVAVYSVRAEKPFSLAIKGRSKVRHKVETQGDALVISGCAPDYAAPNYLITKPFPIRYDKGQSTAFCLAVKVDTDGKVKYTAKSIVVEKATYANIYSMTGTGFKGYSVQPVHDRRIVADETVARLLAFNKDYDDVRRAHVEDFARLWQRQSLGLKRGDGDVAKLLGDARKGKFDAELVNLVYDYGKYLTVSASRTSQPMNLQGQWNRSVRPPWSSNLTTNINAEMNYWGASRAGLAECLEPFRKAVGETVERGKATAKICYGARGFACNHNVDIWRNTSPVRGNPCYMHSPLCGAWLANELYTHDVNCGNVDGNTRYAVEQAALFCLDYLWEYNGRLVTAPSASPEAEFVDNGKRVSVGMSSAFDLAVIRQTFVDCVACSADEALVGEVKDALEKLADFEISSDGVLCEWSDGKHAAEKGHRHFSPLYGVYPGNTFKRDSDLFRAAYALFRRRTENAHSAIGWSAAWAMCLAGRFLDADTAEKTVKSFLSRSVMDNLFDFHPPCYFQIDGNLGFVAGVNEMLLTVDDGVITLLPACFGLIADGEMKGAVVNGVSVDFAWHKGEVVAVKASAPVRVKDVNLSADAELVNVTKV